MESVPKSRRKFVPDWVRAPNATREEKEAVWQLAAQGYQIQEIKEKLELEGIGLDRETISKIIREAIEDPAIPLEQVKKLDPVVREWIISKRPHIKDAVAGIIEQPISRDEKRLEIVAINDRWIELRDPQEPEPKKGKVSFRTVIDLYNMETHSVECVYFGEGQWRTLYSVMEEELRQAKRRPAKAQSSKSTPPSRH